MTSDLQEPNLDDQMSISVASLCKQCSDNLLMTCVYMLQVKFDCFATDLANKQSSRLVLLDGCLQLFV